jgi:hypothetical protein
LQSAPQANAPAHTLAGAAAPPEAAAGIASPSSHSTADKPADFDYTQAPSSGGARGELAAAAGGGSLPAGGTTEPVFIVRAGGRGEVLLVESPSPAFLQQLARESAVRLPDAQLPPAVRIAAESAGAASSAPLVRGQSPFPTALANQPSGIGMR